MDKISASMDDRIILPTVTDPKNYPLWWANISDAEIMVKGDNFAHPTILNLLTGGAICIQYLPL